MRQFIAIFAAFLLMPLLIKGSLDHKEKAGIRPSAFGDRYLSGFDRGATCCNGGRGFTSIFTTGKTVQIIIAIILVGYWAIC